MLENRLPLDTKFTLDIGLPLTLDYPCHHITIGHWNGLPLYSVLYFCSGFCITFLITFWN